VLNKQRNFIYEQRNAILADTDLIERVRTSATEMLEDRSDLLDQSIKENQNKAIADFCSWLFDTFGIDLSPKQVADLHRSGTIIQEIQKLLDQDLSAKIESAGAESLNFFIRFSYLQEIDEKWLDHLESMEALREAVYLRSYAQKNPLLEYKLEGSDIFESLILSIRHNIASKVFRVRIQQKVEQTATIPSRAPRIEVAQTSHQSVGSFAGESEAVRQESAIAAAAAPPAATVIRQGQKIGRNDPCPCGSGKKYKHCHGR